MPLWQDLLAAVPSGAAEALTGLGISGLIARMKDDSPVPTALIESLEGPERDVDLAALVEYLSHASWLQQPLQQVVETNTGIVVGSNLGTIIQNVGTPNPQ